MMGNQKESMSRKVFGAFFVALVTMVGLLIGIVLFVAAFLVFARPNYLPQVSKLLVMPDANGETILLSNNAPVILRIDLRGIIGVDDLKSDVISSLLFDSHTGLLKGDRIRAILLYIDTPGGTVHDSDGIYRAFLSYKKQYQIPVYAFVDGLCASGGMYIASVADQIFATPCSIIGSVGVVFGPSFNFSELMKKIGISSITLTEGKDKDLLNPFRSWKANEGQGVSNAISGMYEQFVAIVSTARPMLSKEKLIQEYGAKIYISHVAEKLGYIDNGNSNYSQALELLARKAGISPAQKYQVVQLISPKPFLSILKESILGKSRITHEISLPFCLPKELCNKFLYLYDASSG